jgi:competence protein ComEC
LLMVTTSYWSFHFRPKGFQTVFIDIGQGDAALLRFPRGKTMLIDGGGFYDHSFDTGKNIIAPLLLKNRICRVDYLVMSHPHPDHFDGLRFIAKNFSIQEFWSNGDTVNDPNFKQLREILREKGVALHALDSDSPDRVVQGVRVEFLHPPPGYVPAHSSANVCLNNRSLVVRFSYGSMQCLFAGDIHAAAEEKLLSTRADISSLVVKVPHHGSLTSCSAPFIEAVSPCIAVCSVGHQNPFRLPHAQVLQRFRDTGCAVYRTDVDGAVAITADDEGVRVRCGETLSER